MSLLTGSFEPEYATAQYFNFFFLRISTSVINISWPQQLTWKTFHHKLAIWQISNWSCCNQVWFDSDLADSDAKSKSISAELAKSELIYSRVSKVLICSSNSDNTNSFLLIRCQRYILVCLIIWCCLLFYQITWFRSEVSDRIK